MFHEKGLSHYSGVRESQLIGNLKVELHFFSPKQIKIMVGLRTGNITGPTSNDYGVVGQLIHFKRNTTLH